MNLYLTGRCSPQLSREGLWQHRNEAKSMSAAKITIFTFQTIPLYRSNRTAVNSSVSFSSLILSQTHGFFAGITVSEIWSLLLFIALVLNFFAHHKYLHNCSRFQPRWRGRKFRQKTRLCIIQSLWEPYWRKDRLSSSIHNTWWALWRRRPLTNESQLVALGEKNGAVKRKQHL